MDNLQAACAKLVPGARYQVGNEKLYWSGTKFVRPNHATAYPLDSNVLVAWRIDGSVNADYVEDCSPAYRQTPGTLAHRWNAIPENARAYAYFSIGGAAILIALIVAWVAL